MFSRCVEFRKNSRTFLESISKLPLVHIIIDKNLFASKYKVNLESEGVYKTVCSCDYWYMDQSKANQFVRVHTATDIFSADKRSLLTEHMIDFDIIKH